MLLVGGVAKCVCVCVCVCVCGGGGVGGWGGAEVLEDLYGAKAESDLNCWVINERKNLLQLYI